VNEASSPMFELGRIDGAADVVLIGLCPPQPPAGPQPPDPAYPVMYQRGYDQEFAGGVPHICTERCRR